MLYPVINDGVTSFRQNQYGQKSIQLGGSAYKTFAQPMMTYMSKPYQYVSPYIKKADDLGDQTLSRVDEKFPAVKKPTEELYSDAKSIVLFPYHKGMEGKDHVLKTYNKECKKVGGEGIVAYGKALISTVFVVGSESITWVGDFLSAKQAEVKDSSKANN
jgi:hypothetical protein